MIYRSRFDGPEFSRDAINAFHRDGVIVLEDFATAAQCDALKQRALALLA